jgi:hypothetical protein
MPLLEVALDRQVLRQTGAVYQFRHAESLFGNPASNCDDAESQLLVI